MFVDKARNLPKTGALESGSLGYALALPENIRGG
jgi:hypothetical protein